MLTEQRLRRWIRQLQNGHRSPQALVEELRRLPFENLGFARLDTHRRLRRGMPEVVLCQGKSSEHLIQIVRRFVKAGELTLLTRLAPDVFSSITAACPALRYDPIARIAYVAPKLRRASRGLALVVTGGTADLPVAEEASVTLELLGNRTVRVYDVGVAGLHRLLDEWQLLQRARVIVAVAGMEGALPSVVAGLVRCPVIAVPTSVGYGAHFHGLAPLLAMLNSCAPGVGVVNIDNGFGAAALAHLINQPP